MFLDMRNNLAFGDSPSVALYGSTESNHMRERWSMTLSESAKRCPTLGILFCERARRSRSHGIYPRSLVERTWEVGIAHEKLGKGSLNTESFLPLKHRSSRFINVLATLTVATRKAGTILPHHWPYREYQAEEPGNSTP
jgi:hypothetical protein